MKKMKIAMFGQKHVLSREGGVEIVVKELSRRMVMRGHSVSCFDRSGDHVSGEKLDKRQEFEGVHIETVFTVNKKGLSALSSSFFAAIKAATGRFDIVHIHAEGPAAMTCIPKSFGKKVIVTIHGLDWNRAKWGGFASRYIKWGEKQAVKYADSIIVLSKKTQDYFKDTYGRDTFYIPNGVNKPNIRKVNKIKELWDLDKDSYVLFLGRIVPEKGIGYLIEAWKGIQTNKKLVIVGGSSDTEEYVSTIKQEASKNMIFTGFQQGEILEELYSNSYIYVLPSDLEGMPLSLLEAMSYGNCCLVSDIPECKEVVEDKAICFKHGNVENLKDILTHLLTTPEIVDEYKKNASDYIYEKYNWDDVVDKTLEVYQK